MPRIRIASLGALAAACVLLAACTSGSPSGGDAGGSSDKLTHIDVGLLTIAPAAAVQYGIDQGIFKKHGLDVKVTISQGGAAMLPAVSTDQLDFGVGNPLSVLTAASQGVDMRIATGYSSSLATGDDINAVVTRADAGIKSWKDLAGKKVSVNAVNTQGDLTIKDSVAKDGGNADAVKFVEVAFPDALAQLDKGNVDAVWIPEPFLSQALAAKDKYALVGYPNQNSLPGLPTMVTFTSGKFADGNPKVVKEWREAIADTTAAATADRAGFGTTIAKFTGMPDAAAANLRLEKLSADIDPAVLTNLSKLAAQYKFIKSEPDLDKVILK